ncbi:MAG: sugar ABC transporter ATP-binding protein [Gammaproteobacteria bacterium]|nr:sugar ABC transporter ATP-binding protein [Gammaproteobacteria bacterium]
MTAWLELRGIKRSFGAIHALQGVDLTVNHGEIIGLVGENGAGKSTLVKIMSGFDADFEGEFLVDGKPAKLGSPQNANAIGIAIAQQELSLIPTMTVAENIFLGHNRGPGVCLLSTLADLSRPLLEQVGLANLSPTTPVRRLSIGERHLVEVARLIAHEPQLLILDEPTAALGESDSRRILAMAQHLKEQGKSIVYVSHRMNEIFKITDRCAVLRDGRSEATVPSRELNTDKLVALMLGRELGAMFPEKPGAPNPVARFKVERLRADRLQSPVSFEIRCGEILGIAGQLGSGSGEILATLAGARKAHGGALYDMTTGKSRLPASPRQAIRRKIAYCSPDRKHDGLFLGRPIMENLSAPNLKKISTMGLLRAPPERGQANDIAKTFTIDAGRLDQEASVLSGGNQQKVALGKWLSIEPELILVDEPTRGVDVGARAEIYAKIRALANQGAAVVIASTDLLEISNLPDRVITFFKGVRTGELAGGEITSDGILRLITNPEPTGFGASAIPQAS